MKITRGGKLSRRPFVILALVASMLGSPSTPAVGPIAPSGIAPLGAGPLYSDNVSLVTTLPDTGMVGGRFAGDYFFATVASGIYFEGGPTSGVRIFDVSNPEAPMPVGVLPLRHGENEDVDVSVSRRLLLVSMETYGRFLAPSEYQGQWPIKDFVHVVSWADPSAPVLLASLELPGDGPNGNGPGHTISCIEDCKRYAYVAGAGGGSLLIVDLADPSNPSIAGYAAPNKLVAGKVDLRKPQGYLHDVNTDQFGRVWVVGAGGTAQLDVRDPLRPVAVRWMGWRDNAEVNQSIHHNSLAVDRSTLLATEESVQPLCDTNGDEQGSFQTLRVHERKRRAGAVTPLDTWITEAEAYGDGARPLQISCSSHWFTFNSRKVVSVGWYDQGVRFLDVSNPRDIRQVGYWLGPAAQASAAYFVPGRDDLVYVADYYRGLDVVRIENGGAGATTVRAPLREEWFTPGARDIAQPDARFGWACRRFRPLAPPAA